MVQSTSAALSPVTDSLIAQLVEQRNRGEKIVISVRGAGKVIVDDDRTFECLLDLIEEVEIVEGIRRGLTAMKQGRTIPFDEFVAQKQKKYGLAPRSQRTGKRRRRKDL